MSDPTKIDRPQIQTGTLSSGGELRLPVADVLTGRAFLTGKSGSGKSNSASVVVEELLDQGHAVLIVDADGEYRGLKEEYEILHVGAGEVCDLEVGPEHAEKIAEIALVQNVPVVLDVSGYLDGEEAETVVQKTADALYKKEADERRPFLLVVEEMHEYLPEEPALDEVGKTFIRIGKRGRKRGLGLMGISQRPADVKKSFITQCDWLVWHRLTWDNDTKVVRSVIGSSAAERVQSLKDGQSIVISDWLDESPALLQWRRKKTVDLGATPGLGETKEVELKGISTDVIKDLQEISRKEKRRASKIAQLEDKIEELRDRNESLEEELERAQDVSELADQLTSALAASGGDSEAMKEEITRIREEKNAEIRDLRRSNQKLRDELDVAQSRMEELEQKAANAEDAERIAKHMDDIEEAARRLSEIADINLRRGKREKARPNQAVHPAPETNPPRKSSPVERVAEFLKHEDVQRAVGRAKETESQKQVSRILTALVEDEGGPTTIEEICNRAGIKPTGGNLSRLRSAAEKLQSLAVTSVKGSGKGTKIELKEDVTAVQNQVGRVAMREEIKDVV
jgi:hypothetical protein